MAMAEYELMDESEIPEGSSKLVTLDGIEIGIIKSNGHYYAFRNHMSSRRRTGLYRYDHRLPRTRPRDGMEAHLGERRRNSVLPFARFRL